MRYWIQPTLTRCRSDPRGQGTCVRMLFRPPCSVPFPAWEGWLPPRLRMFSASNSGGPPQPRGRIRSKGQRLPAQAAATADTAAERGPTMGGGFPRWELRLQQSNPQAGRSYRADYSHGSQNESQIPEISWSVSTTQRQTNCQGSHRGSPEGSGLSPAFLQPGEREGAA